MSSSSRFKQIGLGISLSLIMYVPAVLLIGILNRNSLSLGLATSPLISFLCVMLACLYLGFRFRTSLFLSVPIGYGFVWLITLLGNRTVASAILGSSFSSFLMLLFVVPITVVVSGLIGIVLGRVSRSLLFQKS